MKHVELARKTKSSSHWTRLAAVSLIAVAALAGCGGGSDGAPGAPGLPGVNGTDGTNGTDSTATVSLASISATDWANLAPVGTVTSVAINSPPVVSFKVVDGYNRPVVGLTTTQIKFAIAKLVPGTSGSPSNWVNYLMGNPDTGVPNRPSNEGVSANLVDNKDGTYQYTFAADITGTAASYSAKPNTLQAKIASYFGTDATKSVTTSRGTDIFAKVDVLGTDGKLLDYDPSLNHRVVVQLSGAVNGGTLKNPINMVYDFVPATGAVLTSSGRDIVTAAACSSCHGTNFGTTPHAGRVDTRYCVVCHTDQRKAGRQNAVYTSSGFVAGTSVTRVNDKSWGDLPTFVHKIHAGEHLSIANSNYAGVKFAEVTYPQPITNCTSCHDGAKSAQGDNWKNAPSIKACGSCHDGIDFATGKGTALGAAGQIIGGHVGGAKADDSQCATCHGPVDNKAYHLTLDSTYIGTVSATFTGDRAGYPLNTVDKTAPDGSTNDFLKGFGPQIPVVSQLNPPAGVYKIGLELKSATLAGGTGANKATVVYRILKDGAPVTLNKAACALPYTVACLIDGVDGTPSIYIAYGIPQDGMAADGSTTVDWNKTMSVTVASQVNTQTGPDESGYYTATLSTALPDTAKMVTAALGINYNGFVQINNTSYPHGIRLREPAFAMVTATGKNGAGVTNAARRTVVDNAKCNSCHGQLGVEPTFHGGARNNGAGCAMCHMPDTATGHGQGWSVQSKNLVHGIHAAAKRSQPFTYEPGFPDVTYPGVLKNCEQCHTAGSYDFSASVNKAAASNLLWTTDAKGVISSATTTGVSPWVADGTYTNDNLVSSPIAASCFGCHDSALAKAHMESNNGTLVKPVSTVSVSGTGVRTQGFAKVETCMVCHASGRDADIKVLHSK